MAEKRMFSNKITQSDAFLQMPTTAQNLYWHLSMDADDDGFVNRPRAIMRMVNASDDDMNILIMRKFIIPFDVKNQDEMVNMICVIKHWFIHNTIRSDRKKSTTYIQERNNLVINQNGAYSLKQEHELPLKQGTATECQPNDNHVTDKCPHRLVEISIDKYRLEENSIDEQNVRSTDSNESVSLIMKDGNQFHVDSKTLSVMSKAYPEKDIDVELRKMSAWLYANPQRRKTKSGMNKFINNWLSRGDDNQSKQVSKPQAIQPDYESNDKSQQDVNDLMNQLDEIFK